MEAEPCGGVSRYWPLAVRRQRGVELRARSVARAQPLLVEVVDGIARLKVQWAVAAWWQQDNVGGTCDSRARVSTESSPTRPGQCGCAPRAIRSLSGVITMSASPDRPIRASSASASFSAIRGSKPARVSAANTAAISLLSMQPWAAALTCVASAPCPDTRTFWRASAARSDRVAFVCAFAGGAAPSKTGSTVRLPFSRIKVHQRTTLRTTMPVAVSRSRWSRCSTNRSPSSKSSPPRARCTSA